MCFSESPNFKEETEIVLEELPLNEDVLIKFPFNTSILNIVWRIVAGKRFEVTTSFRVAPDKCAHKKSLLPVSCLWSRGPI